MPNGVNLYARRVIQKLGTTKFNLSFVLVGKSVGCAIRIDPCAQRDVIIVLMYPGISQRGRNALAGLLKQRLIRICVADATRIKTPRALRDEVNQRGGEG